MEFKELQENIIKWAEDKQILCPENQYKQLIKCMEELGELSGALLKKDNLGIIDGLGDTIVTLIILSKQLDLDLVKCLESAYNEIKDRTGKNENGIFIKDAN